MTSTLVRRIARWLVAIMVFAALQPAAAAAWASHNDTKVEVCTSQGMRWVSVGDLGAPDQDTTVDPPQADHCTLCRVLADALPDLSRTDLRFAAPRWLKHVAPPAPRLSDGTLLAVLTAPPRAPPALG